MKRFIAAVGAVLSLAGCQPAECSDDQPLWCENGNLMRCSDGQIEVALYCEGSPCEAPCVRTICIFYSCGDLHGGGCCGDRMTW